MFPVDLTDRNKLKAALQDYLSMGVCPVASERQPGPMTGVDVRVSLPDGSAFEAPGRVIQRTGDGFLVQLETTVDLGALEGMCEQEEDSFESTDDFEEEDTAPGDDATPGPEAVPDETAPPEAGVAAQLKPPEDEDESAPLTGYETDYSDAYQRIRKLPMVEKQKLARKANKTIRGLLIRDHQKPLHIMVIKNPKITLDEVVEYSRMPGLSAEALKYVAQNRTWVANRTVAFNVVKNPSTPMTIAIGLLSKLSPNEQRQVAKSTSIRVPIAIAARKLLFGGRGR